jgi:hypothetical protein
VPLSCWCLLWCVVQHLEADEDVTPNQHEFLTNRLQTPRAKSISPLVPPASEATSTTTTTWQATKGQKRVLDSGADGGGKRRRRNPWTEEEVSAIGYHHCCHCSDYSHTRVMYLLLWFTRGGIGRSIVGWHCDIWCWILEGDQGAWKLSQCMPKASLSLSLCLSVSLCLCLVLCAKLTPCFVLHRTAHCC